MMDGIDVSMWQGDTDLATVTKGLDAFAKSKPTFSVQHSTVMSPGDRLGVQFTYSIPGGGTATSEIRSGEWSGFAMTYFGQSNQE